MSLFSYATGGRRLLVGEYSWDITQQQLANMLEVISHYSHECMQTNPKMRSVDDDKENIAASPESPKQLHVLKECLGVKFMWSFLCSRRRLL